jgi:hypothetical protein
MRLRVVGNLVTDTWCEDERATVSELCLKFTVEAKQDVSLFTPMIGEITR